MEIILNGHKIDLPQDLVKYGLEMQANGLSDDIVLSLLIHELRYQKKLELAEKLIDYISNDEFKKSQKNTLRNPIPDLKGDVVL